MGLDGLRRERAVGLEVAVPAALRVTVDPGHLSRVLRNVIGNAIAHSPAGGRVAVSAVALEAAQGAPAAAPATVAIRVADEGPGIAPDDVPHVFERFYRADPARAVDPATGRRTGSGLGLTIARELLAANGGRIEVESTGPTGTTFRIDLPRG